MYKDSKRTCTAIVLPIKPFVLQHSRRRRRRGLIKLPKCIPLEIERADRIAREPDANAKRETWQGRSGDKEKSKNL